jgi:hypothetical protein
VDPRTRRWITLGVLGVLLVAVVVSALLGR